MTRDPFGWKYKDLIIWFERSRDQPKKWQGKKYREKYKKYMSQYNINGFSFINHNFIGPPLLVVKSSIGTPTY
jgi:hypothetical protein